MSELESKSGDPSDTDASKDRDFCRVSDEHFRGMVGKVDHTSGNFMIVSVMGPASVAGILSFRVFPDNDPIKLSRFAVGQGRVGPRKNPCAPVNPRELWAELCLRYAPDVGVLLKRLTNGKAKAPKRDVVRNIRSAYGSEAEGQLELAWLENLTDRMASNFLRMSK